MVNQPVGHVAAFLAVAIAIAIWCAVTVTVVEKCLEHSRACINSAIDVPPVFEKEEKCGFGVGVDGFPGNKVKGIERVGIRYEDFSENINLVVSRCLAQNREQFLDLVFAGKDLGSVWEIFVEECMDLIQAVGCFTTTSLSCMRWAGKSVQPPRIGKPCTSLWRGVGGRKKRPLNCDHAVVRICRPRWPGQRFSATN